MVSAFPLLAVVTFGKVVGWILAALAVLLFFSLTILIHEGGHFLAARWLGLRVDAFSLGFGPALWKRRIKGVEYKVGAIPFGGYVALPQLDPSGMQTLQGDSHADPAVPEEKRRKAAAPPIPPAVWWKRILVAAAGPAGNVLFAAVLSLLVSVLPPVVPEALRFDGAVIGEVREGSDAESAGLRRGDRVLRVSNRASETWSDFITDCHLCAESDRIELLVTNLYDGAAPRVVSARLTPNRMGYMTVSGVVEAAVSGVGAVVPRSAADRAGLREDDVVFAVDGGRIVSIGSFAERIAAGGGRPVTLSVLRDRDSHVVTLDPELALEPLDAPLDSTGAGALVGCVETDSPAAAAGLRAGDRIDEVNGAPVRGWFDFRLRTAFSAVAACLLSEPDDDGLLLAVTNVCEGGPVRQIRAPVAPDPALFGRPAVPGIVAAQQCLVLSVTEDSPAASGGIEPGDVIASVGGRPVLSSDDFISAVRSSGGSALDVTLFREGNELRVTLVPEPMELAEGEPPRMAVGVTVSALVPDEELLPLFFCGIDPVLVSASVPQWAVHRRPGAQLKGDAKAIWRILGPLVGKHHKGERARIGKALGGPVMILSSMWLWLLSSFTATIAFVRFLNVNLAIINLLPLPVLDGGHIVFALWRGIFRRELPPRVLNTLVNAFAIAIILLFFYLCFHDVWSMAKLFGK